MLKSDYRWEEASEETIQAMRDRCEEERSHQWENCCNVVFDIYQRCKWCGKIK